MNRRQFLVGLPLLLALPGCAGLGHGAAPGLPSGPRADPAQASRLRIAFFELERLNLLFHNGMIIQTPQERILYDPAGWWRHPDAQRVADVTYHLTPELEAAYLNRTGLSNRVITWRLHLFEKEVPDSVALRAAALARTRPAALRGTCAPTLASFLRRLPGFEDLWVGLLPEDTMEQLQARGDLAYSTRLVG